MKTMRPIEGLRALGLAGAALLAAPAPMARAADAPALAGHWKLNRERSEDARKKIADLRDDDRRGIGRLGPLGPGPRGGGPMGGGPMGRRPLGDPGGRSRGPGNPDGPLADVVNPPETLAITEEAGELSFDDGEDVRRIRPDGRKVKRQGGEVELKARYKDGDLVIETEREEGGKMVATYHVTADGKELHVDTQFELPTGEKLEVRHIYDAVEGPATSAR
jgi:hypothetical protein